MIKLVRPIAQSSYVCRHPVRPPDHLPVSYYLADAVLSASPSPVGPPVSSPGSCSTCRRSPALSASAPSSGRSPVPGRFSDSRRDTAAIDCPLFPRSRVDVSGDHLSTCCLIKWRLPVLLDRICMKSAHWVLQPSVTVEINFFWF